MTGDQAARQSFFLNPKTGAITVIKKLIKNTQMTIFIQAKDGGSPPLIGSMEIRVTVTGSTTLAFSSTNYAMTIDETKRVGESVIQTRALPDNNNQYILKGYAPYTNYFGLSSQGLVTVKKNLKDDTSNNQIYKLLVEAQSIISGSRQTATAEVVITVRRNLNPPTFTLPKYTGQARDISPIGFSILKVLATDLDNDKLKYSIDTTITPGLQATNYFNIDPQTGEITIKRLLQNIPQNNITFYVKVSDQRSPEKTARAIVEITVLKNSLSPQFELTPYSATVDENAVNGYIVFRNIKANDGDLQGTIRYELTGIGVAPYIFSLNSLNYVVLNNQKTLQQGTNTSYTLSVEAYDSVYPNDRARTNIIVTVIRNSSGPKFSLSIYRITITDTYPFAVPIISVTAIDPDKDTVRYSIKGNQRALDFYFINSDDGALYLKKLLTGVSHTLDQILVEACDTRSPIKCDQSTVFVTITKDSPPVFIRAPYSATILKSSKKGDTILTATAQDSDNPPTIVYEILGYYGAQIYFGIFPNGVIYQKESIQNQNIPEYTLLLAAYDPNNPNKKGYTNATITVTLNPNAPVADAFKEVNISDTTAAGEEIMKIAASDKDGDKLTYTMVGDKEDTDTFLVFPSTGAIIVRRSLKGIQKQYTFDVIVSDGSKTAKTIVKVNVQRDQDNPPFFVRPPPISTVIPKDYSTNQIVFTALARDNNLKGSIVYKIVGDSVALNIFTINPNNGQIKLQRSILSERPTSYKIQLVAYDSGVPATSATAEYTVNIDQNPYAPAFQLPSYYIRINETVPVATSVLEVIATDRGGDTLRYEMVTSPNDIADLNFFMTGKDGIIYVKRDLALDNTISYRFSVRASDSFNPPKTAVCSVQIDVIRDRNLPAFQLPYIFQTDELKLPGTFVGNVRAIDIDNNGQVRYKLLPSGLTSYYFNFDPITGRISIKEDLNTDRNTFTYILQVAAYNTLFPTKIVARNFTIVVQRNLNSPIFTPQFYSISIPDTKPVGDVVLTVTAVDSDRDKLVYSITADATTLTYFYIATDTGAIILKKPLTDNTVKNYVYRMTAIAKDQRNPERNGTAIVTITATESQADIQFVNLPNSISIPDTTALGNIFFNVNSNWKKLPSSGKTTILHKLEATYPESSFFDINSNGAVSVTSDLRKPGLVTTQFNLQVIAYQDGNPNVFVKSTLTVNVIRNPNPPVWDKPVYTATLSENQPPFVNILKVTATDKDPQDTVTYSLVSEQANAITIPSPNFYVEPSNGNILLRRVIKNTIFSKFWLNVRACDDGSPIRCSDTTVNITLQKNLHNPQFSQRVYIANIVETRSVNYEVLTLTATDLDIKGKMQYEIAGTNSGLFSVDKTSGKVLVARSLLFAPNKVQFEVEAYDSLDPVNKARVTVVIDIRKNPSGPSFLLPRYFGTVNKNDPVGVSVVSTTARDSDGDVLVYSLADKPGTNSAKYFLVHPNTGLIRLNSALQTVGITTFNFFVKATDNRYTNAKTATADVTVNVVGSLQPPTFGAASCNRNLPENQQIGFLFTVKATSPQAKGNMQYTIDGIYPAKEFFEIDNLGNVRLKRLFTDDTLQRPSYSVQIFAFDTTAPSLKAKKTCIISVTRSSQGPVFQPSASLFVSVPESRTVGSAIFTLTATDTQGGTVTYRLLNTSVYFGVETNTGAVKILRSLTSAPNNVYILTVEAANNQGRTSRGTLQVLIQRKSGALPTFVNLPNNVTISSDQSTFTSIFTALANVVNRRGNMKYEIEGFFPSDTYFRIDTNNGGVYVKKDLRTDPLSRTEYKILIVAYEDLNPTQKANGLLTVYIDRNPSRPVFQQSIYRVTVFQGKSAGKSILTVTATDVESGTNLFYKIVPNTQGREASNFFYIRSGNGELFATDLSTTTKTIYQFTVEATDNGTPNKMGTATVEITVVKDQSKPQFTQTSLAKTVMESTTIGSFLIGVTASDNDLKGSIEYVAFGDAVGLILCKVDKNTGIITLASSLKSVVSNSFLLKIHAYDTSFPNNKAEATVFFTIIRNSNAPSFTSSIYSVSVNEYHALLKPVTTVKAVDNDNDKVTYNLYGVPGEIKYFYISRSTGEIYLRDQLNNEPKNFFQLTAEAVDDGRPPKSANASVRITVLRNKVVVLSNPTVVIPADPSAVPGTQLVTLRAQDPDLIGKLVYSAIGDLSAPTYFQVNKDTGAISVRSAINFDTTSQYLLRVVVYDSAVPSMRTTATVTINVDRNKLAPTFLQSSYSRVLSVNTPISTTAVTIQARDPENGKIVYSIVPQADIEKYFFINPITGQLLVIGSLAPLNQQTRTFQVKATDDGTPPRSNTVQVTISVTRSQAAPAFQQPSYSVVIKDSESINNIISTPKIVSTGPTRVIKCKEAGFYPAPSFFTVDENTCAVRVSRSLKSDAASTLTYTLRIGAYDVNNPQLMGYSNVTIVVTRNPSPPLIRAPTNTQILVPNTRPINSVIVNVDAIDPDGDKLVYILSGNSDVTKFLYINSQDGTVFLRQPLLTTTINQFLPIVKVVDDGQPPRSSTIQLNIIIQKLPTPKFSQANYSTTITENLVNNGFVLRVDASVPTLNNIVYKVIGDGSSPTFFKVDNVGNVLSRGNLKTDQQTFYTLTIEAYDTSSPTQKAICRVFIIVRRNVNKPTFTLSTYPVNLDQSSSPGTIIGRIQATDADNDVLTYYMVGPSNCNKLFMVNGNNGDMLLVGKVPPTGTVFDCTLGVTDNGKPAQKANATVRVTVTTTTNLPRFTQNNYRTTIKESDPVGNTVIRVSAQRNPQKGMIMYRVVGDYPSDMFFEVDSTTGDVLIKKDPRSDRLTSFLYTLKIEAYDSLETNAKVTTSVFITVTRNTNVPVFNPTQVTINVREDTSVGTYLKRVNVTDAESTLITCKIISDLSAMEYFEMETGTCLLKLKKSLLTDPTQTNTFSITVQASDNGKPTPKFSNGFVTVNVLRTILPKFQNLPNIVTIPESTIKGNLIYTASTVTPTSGNIVYEIAGDTTAQNYFIVDRINGEIRANRNLKNDPAQNTQYNIKIKASNTNSPQSATTETLIVRVRRNLNAPIFSLPEFTKTIPNTFPVGQIVLVLRATDLDNDPLTYSMLVTNAAAATYFKVESNGNLLLLQQLPTTPQTFQFSVKASDNRPSEKTGTAAVKITVIGGTTSNPPVFINTPYKKEIGVNTGVNTNIFKVETTSPGSTDPIEYRFTGTKEGMDYIGINKDTGMVFVKKDLSTLLSNKPVLILLVLAFKTSNPQLTTATMLEITVLKNANPPIFSGQQPFLASIYDYNPVGTFVFNISATDNDRTSPENKIVYALANTLNSDYFAIDRNTGVITVKKLLSNDPNKRKQYQLTVQAQDQGEPPKSISTVVTVNVERNDNPPTFNIPGGIKNLLESTGPLTSVYKVTAVDPDKGKNGEIRYGMIGDARALQTLEIDPVTGIIKTRISLKGQNSTSFTARVTATDIGTDRKTAQAQIIFQVQLTSTPVFKSALYETSVFESTPVGRSIYKVVAEDPSQATPDLEYVIENTVDLFSMDKQGNINVAKSLLNLNRRQVSLTVKAYRRIQPSVFARTTVKINIISNNNPPVFADSTITVTISDELTIGEVFLTVTAKDPDTGENGRVTYNITSVTPPSTTSHFYVNPYGQLAVITRLSQIKNGPTQYRLTITAKDHGFPQNSATMTVIVNVIGNRNAPVFDKSSYTFTITEAAKLNSPVGTVNAKDADNDQITYSIPNRNKDARYFSIDSVTGRIDVAGDIASDLRDQYTFVVIAKDNSTSPKMAEVTVYVNVRRNLNPPIFSQTVYKATVDEYTNIQTSVVEVRASDKDAQQNPLSPSGKLIYAISPTNDYFFISSTQGIIYVKDLLTTNKIGNIVTFTVTATDQSSQPKTATATVEITIRRNQYAPVITPKSITVNISSTYPLTTITSFVVTDRDSIVGKKNPNGEITMSIPKQYKIANTYFAVSDSGSIYLKISLVKTKSAVYRFKVIASDKSWKPKTSEADVIISVTQVDTSSGTLKFSQPFHAANLKENTPAGTTVLPLKITNIQSVTRVVCKLQNNYGKFSVVYNMQQSACDLKVLHEIDYEKDIRVYYLIVEVDYTQTTKRAANTNVATTNVTVRILDVNDNAPIFHFVFQENYKRIPDNYIGVLSSNAGVNTRILTVSATDADSGRLGEIKYSIVDTNVPFGMQKATIINTDVYKRNGPFNYRFNVEARDMGNPPKKTRANVLINYIFDRNRLTLRVSNTPGFVGSKEHEYQRYLSTLYNKTAMIESARAAYDDEGNMYTELIFVLVENKVPHLLTNITNKDLKGKLENNLGIIVEKDPEIIGYLPQTSVMRTKSYIWWMDDPWAALIALAAIIILLCLIGIIVVLFTWSRYTKYMNQYRLHHLANEQTDFMEPPSLKNFETQSLNMFVPADEAERELGEINMTFEGDTLRRVEHQGAAPGVASAVNPLFNQPPQEGPQTTGHAETTTIL